RIDPPVEENLLVRQCEAALIRVVVPGLELRHVGRGGPASVYEGVEREVEIGACSLVELDRLRWRPSRCLSDWRGWKWRNFRGRRGSGGSGRRGRWSCTLLRGELVDQLLLLFHLLLQLLQLGLHCLQLAPPLLCRPILCACRTQT